MSKYGVFSGPYYPVFGHTCVSGSKKCLFFGKFDVLCFLEPPVSKFALCLISDELIGLDSLDIRREISRRFLKKVLITVSNISYSWHFKNSSRFVLNSI